MANSTTGLKGKKQEKKMRPQLKPDRPSSASNHLDAAADESYLPEHTRKLLEGYRKMLEIELTEEDIRVLDEFEEFRKHHPFTLRRLDIE